MPCWQWPGEANITSGAAWVSPAKYLFVWIQKCLYCFFSACSSTHEAGWLARGGENMLIKVSDSCKGWLKRYRREAAELLLRWAAWLPWMYLYMNEKLRIEGFVSFFFGSPCVLTFLYVSERKTTCEKCNTIFFSLYLHVHCYLFIHCQTKYTTEGRIFFHSISTSKWLSKSVKLKRIIT